jgi:hypothetical protein
MPTYDDTASTLVRVTGRFLVFQISRLSPDQQPEVMELSEKTITGPREIVAHASFV